MEQAELAEDVVPVMGINITGDKGKCAGLCICSVDTDTEEGGTQPPRTKCGTKELSLLKEVYRRNEWNECFKETASNKSHKVSEETKNHMARFMKNKIHILNKPPRLNVE